MIVTEDVVHDFIIKTSEMLGPFEEWEDKETERKQEKNEGHNGTYGDYVHDVVLVNHEPRDGKTGKQRQHNEGRHTHWATIEWAGHNFNVDRILKRGWWYTTWKMMVYIWRW